MHPEHEGSTSHTYPIFFVEYFIETQIYVKYTTNYENRQNSSFFREVWLFDLWKEPSAKFWPFCFRSHWKRKVLRGVMICLVSWWLTMDIHGVEISLHHGYPWCRDISTPWISMEKDVKMLTQVVKTVKQIVNTVKHQHKRKTNHQNLEKVIHLFGKKNIKSKRQPCESHDNR